MNAFQTAALSSVLMVAAVASAVHGLRPPRRSLAQVRAILYPVPSSGHQHGSRPHRGSRPLVPGAVVTWAGRTMGDGLRLVDMSAADVVSRVLAGAAIGTFTVVLTVAMTASLGVVSFNPVWAVLATAVGAAAGWVMWSDVRTKIADRRRAFRRTTNDFIQLVAVGLTTDQSVDEAIQFALGVGDSDLFDLLRDELATAPLRGVPLWEALDQLGTTYDQRELCELGGSIERQGTQGVSITDTVNTLATAMRAAALDELERDADRANANLSGPTVGFVVTTIVFLAYPLAIRIGEAFGG